MIHKVRIPRRKYASITNMSHICKLFESLIPTYKQQKRARAHTQTFAHIFFGAESLYRQCGRQEIDLTIHQYVFCSRMEREGGEGEDEEENIYYGLNFTSGMFLEDKHLSHTHSAYTSAVSN